MNPRRNWLSHLQSRKLHPCIAVVYEPPAVFCCCLLSTSKLHIILNQESSKQSISETPTGGLALAPPIARSRAEPLANLQHYRSYVDAETQQLIRLRSHQTFRPVLALQLLGIILRNRCWPTTFHTFAAGDASPMNGATTGVIISDNIDDAARQAPLPCCGGLVQAPVQKQLVSNTLTSYTWNLE
jgi:hypothetical protein